jgi:hypothetical protein
MKCKLTPNGRMKPVPLLTVCVNGSLLHGTKFLRNCGEEFQSYWVAVRIS